MPNEESCTSKTRADSPAKDELQAHSDFNRWLAEEFVGTLCDMSDDDRDALVERLRKRRRAEKARVIHNFVQAARAGELNDHAVVHFLLDQDRVGRMDDERRDSMQRLLDKPQLDEEEMVRLVKLLAFGLAVARVGFANGEVYNNLARRAEQEILATSCRLILDKCAYHPLPELPAEATDARKTLGEIVEYRVALLENQPDEWPSIHQFLRERFEEIERYDAGGPAPSWFDPERMTLTEESRQLGYNWVHNQPIDPMDRPENIEGYLRERFEHVLKNPSLSIGKVSFAKMMIEPHLDRELAASFPNHDTEDWHYFDDGPINYDEPNNRRFLEGAVDDPKNHVATTYCRMIRESLMYRGLVDDTYMNNPQAMSMSLPRSAIALSRMADYAHQLVERGIDHRDIPGYDPIIRCSQSTAENWRALLELTDNTQTTDRLLEEALKLQKYLVGHFDHQDLVNPEDPIYWYNFVPDPDVNQEADLDHPARFMLLEVRNDLTQAGEELRSIDNEVQSLEAHRKHRERQARLNLDRFQREDRSPQFIETMRIYLDEDYVHRPGLPEDERIYGGVKDLALNDLKEADLGGLSRYELATHCKKFVLHDRILRLLAHADFNLRALHQDAK